jgi:dTDP-4-dehydrorhamnose reductase
MNLKLKILILGATGMAGHMINLFLGEKGYDVYSYGRKKPLKGIYIQADEKYFDKLKDLLNEIHFDFIINCVGILNNDAENNKIDAIKFNSLLPHFLENMTNLTKTKIIHLSTDCVFSGQKGGYSEKDLKDGTSFYDQSKSLGELNNYKDLTFRNSIIGPDLNPAGKGLLNWFLQKKDDLFGYSDFYWSGVTTLELAKAIELSFYENITGIFHLVNNKKISKYNLLLLFNSIFKNGTKNIIYKKTSLIDKSLINTRIDFDYLVPSYEKMLNDLYFWVVEHQNLYPHYFI